MRLTNKSVYEQYCTEMEAKDQAAISALIPAMPTHFYVIKNFEATPVEVTHMRVFRRGIYKHDESDRITKAEVEVARVHAAEWTAPTFDTISVYYREKQKYGTVTGAHPYSKIESEPEMAWKPEDLAVEIERRRALYEPREGHAACNYCQKQAPTGSLVSRTIYYRDQGGLKTKVGKYCSDQCGGYDQCGHEG